MNRLKNIMIILVCVIVVIATMTWKLTKKEDIKDKSNIISETTTEIEETEPTEPFDYVDSVVHIENGQEKNYFDVYPYILRSLPSLLQAKLERLERNVSGVSAWIDWDSIEDTQENIQFCVDCVHSQDEKRRLKVIVDKEKEDIEILE